MKTKRIVWLAVITLMSAQLFATDPIEAGAEGLDVAELIIHLAPSIANELNPPVIGAERTVTKATVTDEGTTRTYFIQGQDVYHTGRVLSTYWIRLSKAISGNEATVNFHVGSGPVAMNGHALAEETHELIGPLLNGVYDLAEMDLTHHRVELSRIVRTTDEPLTFELLGVNQVCEHTDLNTFKIIITRHFEHNRPSYVTQLIHPFADDAMWPPPGIVPIPVAQ